MRASIDNGYISRNLIHWTGTDHSEHIDDAEGARVLSLIAATRRLRLSYNPIYRLDWSSEIHEKMVCFTDVPLQKSASHCGRYGRFGIAFDKLSLMNVGAQPVFYTTHVWKRDMELVFDFLQKQARMPTMDPHLLRALLRHFYFTQQFSRGRADATDTFYYEREWRLGAQSLPTADELNRDNALWHCVQEGYPPYIDERIGIRLVDGDDEYFSFQNAPVAFLVVPEGWIDTVTNPHGFEVRAYEELVASIGDDD
jgi:hypothetical protein